MWCCARFLSISTIVGNILARKTGATRFQTADCQWPAGRHVWQACAACRPSSPSCAALPRSHSLTSALTRSACCTRNIADGGARHGKAPYTMRSRRPTRPPFLPRALLTRFCAHDWCLNHASAPRRCSVAVHGADAHRVARQHQRHRDKCALLSWYCKWGTSGGPSFSSRASGPTPVDVQLCCVHQCDNQRLDAAQLFAIRTDCPAGRLTSNSPRRPTFRLARSFLFCHGPLQFDLFRHTAGVHAER